MTQRVRVLIIEDDVQLARDAKREIVDGLSGSKEVQVEVEDVQDFNEGYKRVENGESDVVILDVRREARTSSDADNVAGRSIFERIKDVCFTPVIFWTALPGEVEDCEMLPLVTIIGKEDIEKLPESVLSAVESRALTTIKEIEKEVAQVLREYMWKELGPNWDEYTGIVGPGATAQVLLSRLVRILDEKQEEAKSWHPGQRYIYPPTTARYAPGYIIKDDDDGWWVVLTPACDFAHQNSKGKLDFALIAKAQSLQNDARYISWSGKKSNNKWNELEKLLRATQGRYYYLPRFRDIPDLLVDLQNIRAIGVEELCSMSSVAALASPFAEALLVQHSHYRGRVGVPDLDISSIKARFINELDDASS